MNTYKIESVDTNKDIIRHRFDMKTQYENGSYLHKVFLRFTLPDIYSSNERQFKWIKYIGYNLIENVICNIKLNNADSTQIKLYTYTEWLFIWYEINLSNEEKQNHYDLIGHIPELYDPIKAKINNNLYPVSHLKKQKIKWLIDDNNTQQANFINIANDSNYNKPPTIPSKTLYVPLNFYFSNKITDSLPLHLIDFIEFEIKLRPINKLYTVLLNVDDFIVDITQENINVNNYKTLIRLPENIIFTDNQNFSFSSNVHFNQFRYFTIIYV